MASWLSDLTGRVWYDNTGAQLPSLQGIKAGAGLDFSVVDGKIVLDTTAGVLTPTPSDPADDGKALYADGGSYSLSSSVLIGDATVTIGGTLVGAGFVTVGGGTLPADGALRVGSGDVATLVVSIGGSDRYVISTSPAGSGVVFFGANGTDTIVSSGSEVEFRIGGATGSAYVGDGFFSQSTSATTGQFRGASGSPLLTFWDGYGDTVAALTGISSGNIVVGDKDNSASIFFRSKTAGFFQVGTGASQAFSWDATTASQLGNGKVLTTADSGGTYLRYSNKSDISGAPNSTDTAQTTNDSATTVATVATTTNAITVLGVRWIGDDGTDSVIRESSYVFENRGGTVTQLGTTVTGVDYDGVGITSLEVDIDGTTLNVDVAGKAATTIDWSVATFHTTTALP